MKNVDLKDYLGHVCILEASCYKQRLLINNLESQEWQARNPNLHMEWSASTTGTKDSLVSFGKLMLGVLFGAIGGAITWIILAILACLSHLFGWLFGFKIGFLEAIYNSDVPKSFFITVVVCTIIALVISVISAIRTVVRGKMERTKVAEHNILAEKKNKNIVASSEARVRSLQKQISTAKTAYSQTEARLKQAYSLGVIHPKYRNLVAVSRFYEYFDTGRCNTLQGHEGAYNIYETEIRLDKIITDLDDISSQLGQIRENQYTLYQAVNEGIDATNRVSKVIADGNNRLANIESNSEVSAYYSKITAENTTFDLWYKSLNS